MPPSPCMLEVSEWGSTLTAHGMKGVKMNLTTSRHQTGASKMQSHTTVVGVDLAKRVCQLHGVKRKTDEIKGLKLIRATCLEHVAHRAPCRIAMEACGGLT